MSTSSHTVLDLFCGAGGMSLGFLQAGFRIIKAIDHFNPAIETYNHNIGLHGEIGDLSQSLELPYADVIIGGPPCQGFSSAGLRRLKDYRNDLIRIFAQLVSTLKPKAFVFENVEGFLTAENGDRIIELLDPIIESGYKVHLRKVNAAHFGVPQHRKRVIAIGGLGWAPSFPAYSHQAYGAPGSQLVSQNLPLAPSIMDALHSLPIADTTPPGTIQGHFFRPLSGLELQRAMALVPGQTMRDLPESLQHESFRRRAFRRVMDGTPSHKRGGAPSGIKRLKPDEPSKAVTGGMQGEFIHPFEHRPLTIRECARLQTFPDQFVFRGNTSDQMQLIANAVPPLLAEHIAHNLLRDLEVKDRRSLTGNGEILSFIPTLSSGVSPALKQAIERVRQRYFGHSVVERLSLWD